MMTLQPFVIYEHDQAKALTFAKDADGALQGLREAMLGQNTFDPAAHRAVSAWTAPIDDVTRVCLLGLMAQITMGMALAGREH